MSVRTEVLPARAAVRGAGPVFLAIVLLAFNLRTPVTGIGPLLHDLRVAGVSPVGASVLTTLPSFCFGAAAFAAAGIARRIGIEHAMLAALALMTVGTALRGLDVIPALFVGQIAACGAIGLVNTLLPGLVKRDFPDRVALITGMYVMVMGVGTAAAAGASVPLANWLGGWWLALGFWAIPMLPAVLIWVFCLPARATTDALPKVRVTGIWRSATAWQVTLFMGLQSSLAYIVFGWMPAILRDRGLSAVDAGLVLSVSVVAQAVASLLAPAVATHGREQSRVVVALMALCIAAVYGAMYAPLWTVWLWAVVLGIAQGSLFAVALTVIVLRASDSHVAAQLSGMAQGVGYLLASVGPLLAGLLHDWTHGWDAVAILMGLLAAAGAAAGYGAGRDRTVAADVRHQRS